MTARLPLRWFKSSYSGGSGTECVEAAFSPVSVFIRDSKQPERPHLVVSARAWAEFVAVARCGAEGEMS
ncbi:DUF397 domain-containing protein [Streptomyces sp. NPDC052610]|uniref:DUF397 domain-containing protein n=1 Tax=Streptomyces sp. NPDC052610 TaxID=3154952 RepID=UPI00342E22DC